MYDRDFRGRICELYSESGMSITDFAKKCNIGYTSIIHYLNGKNVPGYNHMLRICQTCGVSADWLLVLTDNREGSWNA